ncbi:arginase family protein [Xanthobacter versatilis]|uniref:hypothetical protein n=1 Tax=Xanthobacter autotrophicus (strain ATCC BAA-1158 / Py2) TaxID=78245 RepID=UPI003728B74B
MRIKVIDLDGALTVQDEVMAGLPGCDADLFIARDLAPRLRLLAGRSALKTLAERLGPPTRGEICFYGSGDFHHLSHLLVSRFDQPMSVVHFDNHPDWTRFPRTLNCGSWVSRLLEQRNIERVVTLGPCSSDLNAPQLKGADLPLLRAGRLEVHPLASGATFYAGPGFETAGVRGAAGIAADGLRWEGLEDGDFAEHVETIAGQLPATPLWITLDKDVLGPDEAVTNWDQGRLPLHLVLQAITRFARHRPVLGMDVCGDYSPEGDNGALRTLLANLDRDQRRDPHGNAIAVNGATNGRILRHMGDILQ